MKKVAYWLLIIENKLLYLQTKETIKQKTWQLRRILEQTTPI